MIKTTNNQAWLKGFDVASEATDSLEVTHLQYSDYTLFCCETATEISVGYADSSRHVNWRKILMYPSMKSQI